MSKEDEERKAVESFYLLNKGKRARGHIYWRQSEPFIIHGIIVDIGSYDLGRTPPSNGQPGRPTTHWTVVLEETFGDRPNGLKHLVVFSSVQLLDDLNQPVRADEPYGKVYYSRAAANNNNLLQEQEPSKVKTVLCHSECTDGYCHRAYVQGIIRASV